MSLTLPTPDQFPAFPYSPPYEIQVDLMRHLYTSIENRQVTIVESPTGTGKTLSLLCASMTWLRDEKDRARKGKLGSLDGDNATVEDWVMEQTRERMRREMEAEEQEYETKLANARKREKALRAKQNARVIKKPRISEHPQDPVTDDDDSFLPEEEDEEDNISPAVKALMAKLEGRSQQDSETPTCTKIYYASRTHSQLTQVLPELQRLKLRHESHTSALSHLTTKRKRGDEDATLDETCNRTVALGSRKHLCINDSLRSKATDIDEACRELLGEKSDHRCPHLPAAIDDHVMNDFRDEILATPKDIEDLATAGRLSNVCPYFASRRAIPQAELVTLPYNLLLQKSSREALGIDLTNQIVVVDEAHNLISTLLSLSTTRLPFRTLQTSLSQVAIYVTKFRKKLSAQNLLHLKKLATFLDALKKYLVEWQSEATKHPHRTEVLNAAEFLERIGRRAVGLNMLAIEKYLKTSKIARKIAGYADKQAEKESNQGQQSRPFRHRKGAIPPLHAVEDLLISLAGATEDGRITLSVEGSTGQEEVVVKYQLLNPAPHFREIVDEARSVILAGGTMSPMSDVVRQLFSHLPSERINTFSCGHIIPSSSLLTVAVTKGPRGNDLDYKASRQTDNGAIDELGQIILNFTHQIPAGMVVFFPSYNFLNKTKEVWSTSKMLDKFGAKKRIFFEPDDNAQVEPVLRDYSHAARSSPPDSKVKGAMLFAVIGAKLSEGLNFSDDLARAVIIVGLPFANLGSSELQERMRYVKRLEEKAGTSRPVGMKDAGAELYENMCMNAVNQSIGRAIRHKGDWAALLLLDRRYSTPSISKKLPGWIGGELKVAQTFGQVVKELGTFYRDKK
ncbi:ATP-dependent DNA helicase chl1 [Marasmius crinis-equi]|uniref:ATP-dependent DNA helicase CHL1 n=1 Tax=Marasmius crinis-equi TaxID=585013 RepID=A0ABR3FLC0_9AGAR